MCMHTMLQHIASSSPNSTAEFHVIEVGGAKYTIISNNMAAALYTPVVEHNEVLHLHRYSTFSATYTILYTTLYYSTTFQSEILHFLLHCSTYLMTNFTYKTSVYLWRTGTDETTFHHIKMSSTSTNKNIKIQHYNIQWHSMKNDSIKTQQQPQHCMALCKYIIQFLARVEHAEAKKLLIQVRRKEVNLRLESALQTHVYWLKTKLTQKQMHHYHNTFLIALYLSQKAPSNPTYHCLTPPQPSYTPSQLFLFAVCSIEDD